MINELNVTDEITMRNWTDMEVITDPTITKSGVVKQYSSSDNTETMKDGVGEDSTKIDGFRIPVLKLNNRVINSDDIISIKLSCEELLPSVSLMIKDDEGLNDFGNKAGFSNVITIIMTMPGEVTYKKASIDFYITSWSSYNHIIYITGEYKCVPLENVYTKQIKCTNSKCPNDRPTIWELLWQISSETGLGFASSPENPPSGNPLPNDGQYRIISGAKYKDYILQEISYAGTDENYFMDVWVDIWGYLVLTNVSWVLNSDVKEYELCMQVSHNIEGTATNTSEKEWKLVNRCINNFPTQNTDNSMIIENYEELSETDDIYYNGAMRSQAGFTIGGSCAENTSLNRSDIEYRENSIQGITDAEEYQQFQKWFFSGLEMSPDRKIIEQKTLRKEWFNKKRMRRLKVTMRNLNLGLQRGTLVNVRLFETDMHKAKKLIDNMKQHFGDLSDDGSLYDDWQKEETKDDFVINHNDERPILNYMLSGMYYIDSEVYEYSDTNQQVTQTLYLIKKDDYIMTADDRYVSNSTDRVFQSES